VTYDPEVRQRWLDALRSGKYEQATHVLRTEDDKYCCLGVLCEVIDPEGWNPGKIVRVDAGGIGYQKVAARVYLTDGRAYSQVPPNEILAVAGLTERFGNLLAEFNDAGETFEQIAKRVEAVPPGTNPEDM
jgi:hypothetical protein